MVDYYYLGDLWFPRGPLLAIGTRPDKDASPQINRFINGNNQNLGKIKIAKKKIQKWMRPSSPRRQWQESSQEAGKIAKYGVH